MLLFIRSNFLIIVFFLLNSYAAGQQTVLKGVVTVSSSLYETGKKIYISGASVKCLNADANQRVTNRDGEFEIIVLHKPMGYKIALDISKGRYKVVNEEALTPILGQIDKIEVSMALPEQLADSKKRFRHIGMTSGEKELRSQIADNTRKIDELKKDSVKNKKEIQFLEEKIAEIKKNEADLLQVVEIISTRFSRVDLDKMSPEYANALKLYEAGDFTAALSIVAPTTNAADVDSLIFRRHVSRDNFSKSVTEVFIVNRAIDQKINELTLKSSIFLNRFIWDSVETCSKLLLKLDSNNYDNLYLASFLAKKRLQLDMAIYYLRKTLSSTTNYHDLVNSYLGLADIESHRNKIRESLDIYFKCVQIVSKNRSGENQDAILLSELYNNIGTEYQSINFSDSSFIYLSLAENYLKSSRNEDNLTKAYLEQNILNSMGLCLVSQGQISEAKAVFRRAVLVYEHAEADSLINFGENTIASIINLAACYDDGRSNTTADSLYQFALSKIKYLEKLCHCNFSELRAKLLLNQALQFQNNLQYAESDSILSEVVIRFAQLNKQDSSSYTFWLATGYLEYGLNRLYLNDRANAFKYAKMGIYLFASLEDSVLIKDDIFLKRANKFGNLLIEQYNNAEPLVWYQDLFKIFPQLFQKNFISANTVSLRMTLGAQTMLFGNIDSSYAISYQLFCDIRNNPKYLNEKADVLANIATYYNYKNDFKNLISYSGQAVEGYQLLNISNDLKLNFKIGQLYQNLAYAKFKICEFDDALSALQMAEHYFFIADPAKKPEVNLSILRRLKIEILSEKKTEKSAKPAE